MDGFASARRLVFGNRRRRERSRSRSLVTFLTVLAVSFALFGLFASFLLPAIRRRDEDSKTARTLAEESFLSEPPSTAFCERVADRGPPTVCAHGGAHSVAKPANTVAAYGAALAAGVPCVEIDVARSSDGVYVAVHTRQLSAMTGRAGAEAGDFTWAELRLMDLGGGGARIPTVAAVLASLRGRHRLTQVTLDLKPSPPLGEAGFAAGVMSLLKTAELGPRAVVWAKSDGLALDVRRLAGPRTALSSARRFVPGRSPRVGLVVTNHSMSVIAEGMADSSRLPAVPDVLSVIQSMVDAAALADARSRGLDLHAWTVDAPEDAARMLHLAIDGIVTNAPTLVQKGIGMRVAACKKMRWARAAARARGS